MPVFSSWECAVACPPSREISPDLSETQKYFLKMKLLQSACLLRLSKDFSNVMSLSTPSELWMKSYWGKQPSNVVFKNCAAEMQQNGFLQVTCSATRNLKRESIVSIHNEPLEGEVCHMPQVGGH